MTSAPHPTRAPLPADLTPFIGRAADLAQLCDLVTARRLVTVTGAGGCGKTRLAARALAALAPTFRDGAGWIDLSTTADPACVDVVAAAATGVVVAAGSPPRAALVSGLRSRHVVLGIDNCEHLADATADLVERLLRSCPHVSVLATSRQPLGLPAETVVRVPPLDEDDALALFADRARAARHDFLVGGDDAVVRTICRRLDGLPLAIELAAPWVRMMAPAQIAAALDDRFSFLVDGHRRAVARHRSLLASLEWTLDLLHDDARSLLGRLAVFAGGFSLDDTTAVCAGDGLPAEAVVPALRGLVDTSLVAVDRPGTTTGYRLTETIRELAARRLAEAQGADRLRARHLGHACSLVADVAAGLDEADHDLALARIGARRDDIRAALEWGLTAGPTDAARNLAAAMARPWFLRGEARAGIDILDRAVALAPHDDAPPQARLLTGLSLLHLAGGHVSRSIELASGAQELATARGDAASAALATSLAAYASCLAGGDRAAELGRAAARLGTVAGERFARDLGTLARARSLADRDRHAEAAAVVDDLMVGASASNDRFCGALCRDVRLHGALLTGDVRAAVELGQDAVRIATPLGDRYTMGTVTSGLAWALGVAGDLERARQLTGELAGAPDTAGDGQRDREVVDAVGLSVTMGRLHLWASDLDVAEAWLRRAAGFDDPGPENVIALRALPALAATLRRLGRLDDAADAARRGAAMAERLGTPHVHAEALDELAALVDGDDPGRADELRHRALRTRTAHGLWTPVADSLDGMARAAAARGAHGPAVRLLAASDAARATSGYPRPPVDREGHELFRAELCDALGDRRYGELYAQGAALTPASAVAYATRGRGPRGRPSAGWPSLTPTELDVVALVSEGLTNPQIAERLFMSRATVKTHLSHVFDKLGVSNRAELAATTTRRSARIAS